MHPLDIYVCICQTVVQCGSRTSAASTCFAGLECNHEIKYLVAIMLDHWTDVFQKWMLKLCCWFSAGTLWFFQFHKHFFRNFQILLCVCYNILWQFSCLFSKWNSLLLFSRNPYRNLKILSALKTIWWSLRLFIFQIFSIYVIVQKFLVCPFNKN